MNREDLHQHYSEKRPEIESRLKEFKALREASDKRLFKELCFVIFTSQSSAEKAWEAAEELDEKNILADPSRSRIESVLEQNQVLHEKRKAQYIVENYNFLSQPTFSDAEKGLKINQRIKSDDLEKTRDWFVENIKGLGMKGGSHFLRNIGYGNGFAIFSSHTVSVLHELGVLRFSEPPKNRKEYLEGEKKVQAFSEEIGIGIQALDLTLWSYRTEKVFK